MWIEQIKSKMDVKFNKIYEKNSQKNLMLTKQPFTQNTSFNNEKFESTYDSTKMKKIKGISFEMYSGRNLDKLSSVKEVSTLRNTISKK
jgi:hypothetical protein